MTDRIEPISPRARRQPAVERPDVLAQAPAAARVLVRLPVVELSTKAPPTVQTELPSESPAMESPTARLQIIRVDPAHDDVSGPHTVAPDWLDTRPSRFARIVQHKSLIAAVLVGAMGVAAFVQQRTSGSKPSTAEEPKVSTVRSERKHRAVHNDKGKAAKESTHRVETPKPAERKPVASKSAVMHAVEFNSPASIGTMSPAPPTSAATIDSADETGDDIFRLYDSPSDGPDVESGAAGGAPAGLRMALRDVTAERAASGGTPRQGMARLGGMLGKLPVLNSQ